MSRIPQGRHQQQQQQQHYQQHPQHLQPQPQPHTHSHQQQPPTMYYQQQPPIHSHPQQHLMSQPQSQPQHPSQPQQHVQQAYSVDPAVYAAYARAAPGGQQPPLPPGSAPGGYPPPDAYNAVAGPSRDPYAAAYHTPAPRAPLTVDAGAAGGLGGWTSVHPNASKGGQMPRVPSAGSMGAHSAPQVKLEDLVAHDRPRSGLGGHIQTNTLTSVPLHVSHSYDPKMSGGGTGGGGPGVGGGAGVSSGSQDGPASGQQTGPSEFIKKLYKMLEEESATYGRGRPAGAPRSNGERGSVGWGRGGSSFVVWDMNEFTTKVLPQTFRHSNFSSFVRQLNKYGFSKIKHVDEESGQIRENVWEFQHPNFQSGGKADLDSIKRKAVVPKKGAGADDRESSPARGGGSVGLSGEDAGRLMDMEGRMSVMEELLYKAQDQLRESRNRESGLLNLVREVINHLAATERETSASPATEIEPSPRIQRLLQSFDQVAQGVASSQAQPIYPPPPNVAFSQPFHASGQQLPYGTAVPPYPLNRYGMPMSGGVASHVSPPSSRTSGGDGQSPAGGSRGGAPGSSRGGRDTNAGEDIIELPSQQQTLYNGEPLTMTPVFSETSGWLTEPSSAPAVNGIYHRKSSDGTTLRLMVEALSGPVPGVPGASIDDTRDPLDNSGDQEGQGGQTANIMAKATIQQSPFGTLLIPPQQQNGTVNGSGSGIGSGANGAGPAAGTGIRLRRSTTIKPSWTQQPRILVVEDDLVYRQLSSKFLEKFGCVVETVENAQQGIEKMNNTKYDLVLMDIFFGPSMDGRKATSLIRQFDIYTPIISMTSNVQTKDVDSYLQSGMNDVLAKPFTKHGLFGILDKHLIHLKAIQLSAEVPRFLGLPPLSDQGVVDAITTGAAQWEAGDDDALRNPLAGTGWSDETYQLVLQQFLTTGAIPDAQAITNGAIGTNLVFPDSSSFLINRKRSADAAAEEHAAWDDLPGGKRARGGQAAGITELS